MVVNLVKQIIGSSNDRHLKRLSKNVDEINALEASLEGLSDDELKSRTDMFRQKIKNGSSTDSLLVEAFATDLRLTQNYNCYCDCCNRLYLNLKSFIQIIMVHRIDFNVVELQMQIVLPIMEINS